MRLKTKLSLGLIFLFVVILLFGISGIYYVSKLGNDAGLVLKNNHESLVYCNNMLKALENIKTRKDAAVPFPLKVASGSLSTTSHSPLPIAMTAGGRLYCFKTAL